jgi:hypothetical protein
MYKCTWCTPLLLFPFVDPLLPFPFVPLSGPLLLTWNPPSCDRICPPQFRVACKLTSLDPNLPPPSPFRLPQTPNTPRLATTTLGLSRRLLSGTSISTNMFIYFKHFLAFYYRLVHVLVSLSLKLQFFCSF